MGERVPLGRIIIRDPDASPDDLTRHPGYSAEELFRKYQDNTGSSALATGRNYCKPIKNVICINGMNGIVVGLKRESNHGAEDSEEEKEEEVMNKRRKQEEEKHALKQQNLATIEARYLSK